MTIAGVGLRCLSPHGLRIIPRSYSLYPLAYAYLDIGT